MPQLAELACLPVLSSTAGTPPELSGDEERLYAIWARFYMLSCLIRSHCLPLIRLLALFMHF